VLGLTATYCGSTCELRSFAMLNAKYAESPMLSGKQSLSDSQQWVFTLTIVGLPLARTLRPSAARPRLPILFFFFTATPPPNAPSIPGNGSSSVFIRACIHAGPYTKPAIDIYVYRIYSPSGIYSSNSTSRSFLPEGRLS